MHLPKIFVGCLLIASTIINTNLVAQTNKTTPNGYWGVYGQIGFNTFVNKTEFDKSIYHFPVTYNYGLGLQYQYMLTELDYLVGNIGVNKQSIQTTAHKFNNTWAKLKNDYITLDIGIAYRMDWSKKSKLYLQPGLLFQINTLNRNSLLGTHHSNNNDVRDYLGAAFIGKSRTILTLMSIHIGYYLDKYKRHELSIKSNIPLYTYYSKSNAPFLKNEFTFADNTQEQYQIDINGFLINVGLQYNFWF